MTTSAIEFKAMIYRGEIEIPKSDKALVKLLDRYLVASRITGDLDESIEKYKTAFLSMQKVKSGQNEWAYISAIKQGLSTNKNYRLNESILALYGMDLTTYAIQRLIVDGKIKLSGKKVFLISNQG